MSTAGPSLSPPSQSSKPHVEVEAVTTIVKSPLLRPTPAFLKVIHYGGGQGDTFSMEEILDYVKVYIDDKKLYDQQNPRIIYCKGNDLGAAFNVDKITIPQVLPTFLKHCTQVKDSHNITINRQINTRPLCENQSTPSPSPLLSPLFSSQSSSSSSSTSSSASSSWLSSQPTLSSRGKDQSSPETSAPSSLLPSSELPASSPVVSSSTSTSGCNSSSNNEVPGMGRCPHTIRATRPSTTISNMDMETAAEGTSSSSVCAPSSSFSITAMDETDGDIPWSCQVEVAQNDEETGGHGSLVVEYSSDNFSVEYELVSSSEAESHNQGDTEESQSPSESTPATAFYLVCEESDIEYLADYSETDSDSDAELGEDDKWECNMCLFRNSAMYRNCGKCWSLRADWLPAGSSLGLKGAQNVQQNVDAATGETPVEPSKTSNQTDSSANWCEVEKSSKEGLIEESSPECANFQISSQDSAIGSMACSQEQVDSKANDKDSPNSDASSERKTDNEKKKRTYSSCLSDSQEELAGKTKVSKIVQGKKSEKDIHPKDPCVICLTRPKTACIIHGKTGHQVCCYSCARMLKKKRKSCPICRRPIQRVVRNYF